MRPDRLDRRLERLRPYVGTLATANASRPMPEPEVVRGLLLRVYGDMGPDAMVEALMALSRRRDRTEIEAIVEEVADAWR